MALYFLTHLADTLLGVYLCILLLCFTCKQTKTAVLIWRLILLIKSIIKYVSDEICDIVNGLLNLSDDAYILSQVESTFLVRSVPTGADENTPEAAFNIENEARICFQQFYNAAIRQTASIEDCLELLIHLSVRERRGKEMIRYILLNFYEEFNLIPEYQQNHLLMAANLFGGIITRCLIVGEKELRIALGHVLNGVENDPTSKMFHFGVVVLEIFAKQLRGRPRYCDRLCKIPHFQQFPQHLIEVINTHKTPKKHSNKIVRIYYFH